MGRQHVLKILPRYYSELIKGNKNWELRYNDRGYQTGDEIILMEHANNYTGRIAEATISYIFHGDCEGEQIIDGEACQVLHETFVILSLEKVRVIRS